MIFAMSQLSNVIGPLVDLSSDIIIGNKYAIAIRPRTLVNAPAVKITESVFPISDHRRAA